MGAEVSQESGHSLPQPGADGGAGPAIPGVLDPNGTLVGANIHSNAQASLNAWPAQASGSDMMSEGMLLSQLAQLLSTRPKNSLLLSDLGALLPAHLRTGVKEKGGLRSWLQKYPVLFEVSGQPGKESVKLMVGTNASTGHAGDTATQKAGGDLRHDAAGMFSIDKKELDEEENASSVQLRGLPYRASVADVKAFLGIHAANLKDQHSAIQLVLNRDGRPSGFARVQFTSPISARAARDALHNAVMKTSEQGSSQERYVEIFLYSERPNKLRFRKGLVTTGDGTDGIDDDADIHGVTKESVIAECREHMKGPGKSQLLLSMLGVALSPPSRLYLKKTDLGLKHFLTQYPQEFSVEGQKGRECITYLPLHPAAKLQAPVAPGLTVNAPAFTVAPMSAPAQSSVAQETLTSSKTRPKRMSKGTFGLETGSIHDLSQNPAMEEALPVGLTSPVPMPVSPGGLAGGARGLATPSDWGTPTPYADWELPARQKNRQTLEHLAPAGLPSHYGVGSSPLDFHNAFSQWPMLAPGLGGPMPPPPWDPNSLSVPPAPWMAGGMPMGAGTCPGVGAAPGLPDIAQMQNLFPASPPPAPNGAGALSQIPEAPCALRLRGLPFTTTEQDIFAFFAKHDVVELIAEVNKAVKMIMKPNGKASGQAIVVMKSRADADITQASLHGQWMGSRYIEVFPNNELPGPDGEMTTGDVVAAAAPPGIAGPPAREHLESTPLADGIGDTGGSGAPLDHGTGPEVHGDRIAAARRAATMASVDGVVPGTCGAGAPTEHGDSSWAALFDFLKKDSAGGEVPAGTSTDCVPPNLQVSGI